MFKEGLLPRPGYPVRMGEGFVLSGILMALLGLLLLVPTLLKFSEAGPGSMRAFWGISWRRSGCGRAWPAGAGCAWPAAYGTL